MVARRNRPEASGKERPGRDGKSAWNANTIRRMLQNEKYKGDPLMQKTYTVDFLSKKMVVNNGEKDQYYVQGNHKPIIPPDDWEAAQAELKRREGFMESHGIKEISSKVGTASFFVRKHATTKTIERIASQYPELYAVAKNPGELPEKEREELRTIITDIFKEKMNKHNIK